ncbi:hypothetical protein POP12_150 [Pectobacterium phage POP12]|nr:hypothetical protein POP12_150 [Pectobacterium phage POP12]
MRKIVEVARIFPFDVHPSVEIYQNSGYNFYGLAQKLKSLGLLKTTIILVQVKNPNRYTIAVDALFMHSHGIDGQEELVRFLGTKLGVEPNTIDTYQKLSEIVEKYNDY